MQSLFAIRSLQVCVHNSSRRLILRASSANDQPSTSGQTATPPSAAASAGARGQMPLRQMPPRMPIGPEGRQVVMGPDGKPVELVRMTDVPEAFSGIASMDRGQDDVPSDPGRVALLAAGDLAVLLAFAAIGRSNHGEPVTLTNTLATALPFILGWFASGAILGGFSKDAQGGKTGAAAAAAAKTWAAGVPAGVVIRSISRGYAPSATFLGMTMGVLGVMLIGWRTALAAAKPQAEALTPAQQAARRRNKQGGIFEGLQMIMSLVRRW